MRKIEGDFASQIRAGLELLYEGVVVRPHHLPTIRWKEVDGDPGVSQPSDALFVDLGIRVEHPHEYCVNTSFENPLDTRFLRVISSRARFERRKKSSTAKVLGRDFFLE